MALSVVLVGLAAGTLTTVAYVPEVVKVLRTRDTKSISRLWLGILAAGMALWTAYGFEISSMPLVVTNITALALVLALASLKIRYG